MATQALIIAVLMVETGLFLVEVLFSVFNAKNKQLRKAKSIDDLDFINLEEGVTTGISWFRVSLVISYVLLVLLLIDFSKPNILEEILVYLSIGIIIYILIVFNIKVFSFYPDRFIVWTPFRFFQPKIMIEYDQIKDFHLYSALYNSFFLNIELKDSTIYSIEFSSSSLPKNNLIIRVILNSKTGLSKDVVRKRWKKSRGNDEGETDEE